MDVGLRGWDSWGLWRTRHHGGRDAPGFRFGASRAAFEALAVTLGGHEAAGWAPRILTGQVESVITALDQQATDAGPTATQRGDVDASIGYLTANQEFLGYDTAL